MKPFTGCLVNMIAGAAALAMPFGPVARERILASIRLAVKEGERRGLGHDEAIRRWEFQRLSGMVLMFAACISLIAATLIGTSRGWPMPVLLLLGLMPMVLMTVCHVANRALERVVFPSHDR
jgi:hypothetical protein